MRVTKKNVNTEFIIFTRASIMDELSITVGLLVHSEAFTPKVSLIPKFIKN